MMNLISTLIFHSVSHAMDHFEENSEHQCSLNLGFDKLGLSI